MLFLEIHKLWKNHNIDQAYQHAKVNRVMRHVQMVEVTPEKIQLFLHQYNNTSYISKLLNKSRFSLLFLKKLPTHVTLYDIDTVGFQ